MAVDCALLDHDIGDLADGRRAEVEHATVAALIFAQERGTVVEELKEALHPGSLVGAGRLERAAPLSLELPRPDEARANRPGADTDGGVAGPEPARCQRIVLEGRLAPVILRSWRLTNTASALDGTGSVAALLDNMR